MMVLKFIFKKGQVVEVSKCKNAYIICITKAYKKPKSLFFKSH